MTEVPEYLLERSRERRAALGLETADAPASTPAVAEPAQTTAVEPATAPAPAAVPAPVTDEPPPPPPPDKPWVAAAKARKRIPMWVVPVAVFLPFWAFVWFGTLEEPPRAAAGPLGEGAEVYPAACASCHGAGGGGGVGPQLNNGEVLLTFPRVADMVAWLVNGSPATAGAPYGDPNRPGGGRTSQGGMPGFAGEGSEYVVGVVLHERVLFGLEDEALLEGWIAFAESGELPEWEQGVLGQEIQIAYEEYLAANAEVAAAVAEAEQALSE